MKFLIIFLVIKLNVLNAEYDDDKGIKIKKSECKDIEKLEEWRMKFAQN